jgi:5-methylcytosine-specific restriction protein A
MSTMTTRRNVSERLKKCVASDQRWKCKMCQEMLTETYEIDHKIPLFKGGNNMKSNLQALCPNCHAKKSREEQEKTEYKCQKCNTVVSKFFLFHNCFKRRLKTLMQPDKKVKKS